MSKHLVMKFIVAVAQASEMSRAEMREKKTSRQVMSMSEMNSVASDVLENQRRSLLNEAPTELQKQQRQNHEDLQEYQQGVRRQVSEVQPEVQNQQVARREEVEIFKT